jgi:hypothetical protein
MLLANPLDKSVGKEAQLCQQFALPTAWSEAVGKADARFGGKPSFANNLGQSCWQSWPMLLAKLGIFNLQNQYYTILKSNAEISSYHKPWKKVI